MQKNSVEPKPKPTLIYKNWSHNEHTIVHKLVGLHAAVAQRVERWTCDQQVLGSNPTRDKSCVTTLGKLFTPICASVTKQHNLAPAKGRWCSAAGKVTAGLAESNGSLPPGGWLIVTCGLTACTPRSAPGPTLCYKHFFTRCTKQRFWWSCVLSSA